MKSNLALPGVFGKLPVLGDFVSRRLPASFVRTWDGWLQGALSASREQLGSRWLDVYLTSPIWRFVLSPGICDQTAWTGVLMPSVDKVGRYFPLTLAVMINAPEALAGLFVAAADWFDELEQLALSALEDDFDLDDFDRNLQALVLPGVLQTRGDHPAIKDSAASNGPVAFYLVMEDLKEISKSYVQLTASLLNSFLPIYSMWSTNGSERVRPSLWVYDGLPPITAYADFLTRPKPAGEEGDQPAAVLVRPPPDSQADPGARSLNDTESAGRMVWRSSARSSVGKRREINEDAFLERPASGLWAVADGMGGHWAGDVASQAVVSALSRIPAGDNIESLISEVTACLQKVNADLIRMARQKGEGQIMGSTIVVMLAVGSQCAAVWAGDSRLYRYRDGILSQLTDDHSLAVELSRRGGFAPDEVNARASGNIVTRALGAEPELPIDTFTYEALRGDTYLLCSDGLVKEMGPAEIADILKQGGCDEASQRLIELALARGARDNVTVIVVRGGSRVGELQEFAPASARSPRVQNNIIPEDSAGGTSDT
ncbi:MAG: type VI secretion system-associated protein TagF [Desulfobacterales bacterium]|nr:MAG: type VI secretion system-associated protein TagF [Desulfobacterales bacterium]